MALARHRPGARTPGQSHRRPGRLGGRRRLFAHGFVLRTNARRFPEPHRAALRQPLRPRLGSPRRRRLRFRRSARGAIAAERLGRALPRRARAPPNCCGIRCSVQARFEDMGTVSQKPAATLGLVGPAARACGLRRTCARISPSGIFQFVHIPISTWHTGDVFARAFRALAGNSTFGCASCAQQLKELPGGPLRVRSARCSARSIVASRWWKAGAARSATWR